MAMTTYTFKLDAALKAEFYAAAEAAGKKPSALLRELMHREVLRNYREGPQQ